MRNWRLLFSVLLLLLAMPATGATQVISGELVGTQIIDGGDPDGRAAVSLVYSGETQSFAWSASLENIALPAEITIYFGPVVFDYSNAGSVLPVLSVTEAVSAGTVSGFHPVVFSQPQRAVAVITNDEYPEGAAQGELFLAPSPGRWVLPVVGRVVGGGGTFFTTDLRLTSRVAFNPGPSTDVTLEFYPSGEGGSNAPAATATASLKVGEMLVVDDVMKEEFGLESALGALVITSPFSLVSTARIYNDARAAGKGTFGQFENGMGTEVGAIGRGLLPHLYNVPLGSGDGLRTNVGWFNDSDRAVRLELTAFSPGPAYLGEFETVIQPRAHQHLAIQSLIAATANIGDFYLVYEVAYEDRQGGTLHFFPYASVTDNVNGDSIFVAPVKH